MGWGCAGQASMSMAGRIGRSSPVEGEPIQEPPALSEYASVGLVATEGKLGHHGPARCVRDRRDPTVCNTVTSRRITGDPCMHLEVGAILILGLLPSTSTATRQG